MNNCTESTFEANEIEQLDQNIYVQSLAPKCSNGADRPEAGNRSTFREKIRDTCRSPIVCHEMEMGDVLSCTMSRDGVVFGFAAVG